MIGDAIQDAEQRKAQQAPPPIVVSSPPRLIWVPQWNAYVLEGHDVVYYDAAYYYFHNGYWWHSSSHAGPWVVVAPPPPGIAKLPKGHLHAHMPKRGSCPPGLAKQGRC